jgi:hypothetical protein
MSMKFTYEDIGCLLIAIGTEMKDNNLCAGATRDGMGDRAMFEFMTRDLRVDEDTARELLKLDNEAAINYIEPI